MANTFKFRINGLQQTLKRIEKFNKELGTRVGDQLTVGAQNIAASARNRAPVSDSGESNMRAHFVHLENGGALRNSISADTSEKFNKRVTAGVPYAAFVEFGTGSRVFDNRDGFVFKPEIKEFAKEFFVSGRGRMPARPFLFPSYEEEKPEILKRIKNELKI